MPALFSVVVLTYNQAHLVEATLNSVYQQSYPRVELIISDDGSRDGTPKIVDKWLSQFSKRFVRCELLISTQNTGISANHNRGVKAARGEFLKYIGGDDILLPGALEKMAKFLEQNPEVKVATSFVQPFLSKEDGEILETMPLVPEKWAIKVLARDAGVQFRYMSRHCFLPAPGFFFRTESLAKIGYFDEEFKRFEDWHTWLKFLASGFRIYFLPEVTVCWRMHPNSVSTSALHKGDKRFFEENILVYQKYVLPYINLLSPLERTHVRARIRFYQDLIRHGGGIKALSKARLNFLFDPIKWVEFPGWAIKQIIRKPMKKIHRLFEG
jgi:glycosyltransferase involved in cell wall biosynthesis